MRSLQNGRSVIIKPADKGSAVVAWNRQDYLKEANESLVIAVSIRKLKLLKKIL